MIIHKIYIYLLNERNTDLFTIYQSMINCIKIIIKYKYKCKTSLVKGLKIVIYKFKSKSVSSWRQYNSLFSTVLFTIYQSIMVALASNCFYDKIPCTCFAPLPNNVNKSGDVAYSYRV